MANSTIEVERALVACRRYIYCLVWPKLPLLDITWALRMDFRLCLIGGS